MSRVMALNRGCSGFRKCLPEAFGVKILPAGRQRWAAGRARSGRQARRSTKPPGFPPESRQSAFRPGPLPDRRTRIPSLDAHRPVPLGVRWHRRPVRRTRRRAWPNDEVLGQIVASSQVIHPADAQPCPAARTKAARSTRASWLASTKRTARPWPTGSLAWGIAWRQDLGQADDGAGARWLSRAASARRAARSCRISSGDSAMARGSRIEHRWFPCVGDGNRSLPASGSMARMLDGAAAICHSGSSRRPRPWRSGASTGGPGTGRLPRLAWSTPGMPSAGRSEARKLSSAARLSAASRGTRRPPRSARKAPRRVNSGRRGNSAFVDQAGRDGDGGNFAAGLLAGSCREKGCRAWAMAMGKSHRCARPAAAGRWMNRSAPARAIRPAARPPTI